MITSVRIEVTNLVATGEKLQAVKVALADMTDAMASLAARLIPFYEDSVFESRGEVIDEPWEPLKQRTIDEKNKNWPGRGMLVRTGEMQRGFTSEITPISLIITNRVPHFRWQQEGTTPGKGRGHNIPARKMLVINSTVEGYIVEELTASVRAKIDAVKV